VNTVAEIRTFLTELMDEPESSFIDTAKANRMLAQGERKFRQAIVAVDDGLLEDFVDLVLTNERSYDLADASKAGYIMGAAPTKRAANLLYMEQIDDDGDVLQELRIVRSRREARQLYDEYQDHAYFSGTKMQWPLRTTGTYRLYFVQAAATDWTSDATIPSPLVEWHDIIAYFAYETYSTHDQAFPKAIKEEAGKRIEAFYDFLQQGFVVETHDQVSFEPNW